MKKNWIKFISFCCLTSIILVLLNCFVFVEVKLQTIYGDFYKQETNSLDLVCVGNSTIMHGVNSCEIWDKFGVTNYNICASPTHLETICIAIDEIARTQSPKVVFIDLNGLTYQPRSSQGSFVKAYIDAMPECNTKTNLYAEYSEVIATNSGNENSNSNNNNEDEIFKYHNNFRNIDYWWNSIGKQKVFNGFEPILTVKVQQPFEMDNSTVLELSEDGKYYLNKILEKCDKYPSINFVFGKMPRFLNDGIVEETYKLRSAIPEITAHGYQYIEWEQYLTEMNLDPKTDVYDEHHLNLNGSIKFSRFFINFLNQQYSIIGNSHSKSVEQYFNKTLKSYIKNFC